MIFTFTIILWFCLEHQPASWSSSFSNLDCLLESERITFEVCPLFFYQNWIHLKLGILYSCIMIRMLQSGSGKLAIDKAIMFAYLLKFFLISVLWSYPC